MVLFISCLVWRVLVTSTRFQEHKAPDSGLARVTVLPAEPDDSVPTADNLLIHGVEVLPCKSGVYSCTHSVNLISHQHHTPPVLEKHSSS